MKEMKVLHENLMLMHAKGSEEQMYKEYYWWLLALVVEILVS